MNKKVIRLVLEIECRTDNPNYEEERFELLNFIEEQMGGTIKKAEQRLITRDDLLEER